MTDKEVAVDTFAYADVIREDLERNQVVSPVPLKIVWFDDKKNEKDAKSDQVPVYLGEKEEASETESIRDDRDDDDDPTEQDIERMIADHEHGGKGSIEDDLEDDDDDDDDIMWPGKMDRLVYQVSSEIEIVSNKMNKLDRKIYNGLRKRDGLPVIVIVTENFDKQLQVNQIPREVRMMYKLRNLPNVCEILGWVPVDSQYYIIILRHYKSCDVVDATKGNLYAVATVVESILQGMKQIHDGKVAHRDIAKDNILWNPLEDKAVIIDFDTACFYRKSGYYRDVGRDRYDAPEKTKMLEKRRKLKESSRVKKSHGKIKTKTRMQAYTEASEVYSVGVLLWMLLNSEYHSPSPEKLTRWMGKVRQRNKHKKFIELDLLNRLLCLDPERRITIEDALEHPFIKDKEKAFKSDYETYRQMKQYLFKSLDMYDKVDKKEKEEKEEKEESSEEEETEVSNSEEYDKNEENDISTPSDSSSEESKDNEENDEVENEHEEKKKE